MAKASPVKKIEVVDGDDHLGKEVRIACTGAALIEIDQLTPFQGELKTLSQEDYKRLKTSILDLGFSFPVAAWKYRNKNYILDAHQRTTTLKRMRDEGYKIPPLPVIWIEASSKNEAAKKLLAATSQYGKMQGQGLFDFMQEFKIEVQDLDMTFKFPEIDFDSFKTSFFPDAVMATPDDPKDDDAGFSNDPEAYTKKIQTPVYEPKGEKPETHELWDQSKANQLADEINASALSTAEKQFLLKASQRHVVFNYERVAEYYCHASSEMQDLMEKSALVIIDFNKAIENGFVVLSEKLAEAYKDAK